MQLTIEIPDELAKVIEPQRERLAEIIRRGLGRVRSGGASPVGEVICFLATEPGPELVIAFKPSEESTLRLRELLDRNREGTLSADEETELDMLESLDDLVALLKLQARRRLAAEA